MKQSLFLLLAAVAVLLLLFFVSSTGKKPPSIPQDAAHQGVLTQEGCLLCHGPGKTSPLKDSHPPKEQCLVCHKAKKG